MKTAHLKISGMTCNGCANSVTRVLQGLVGVKSATVNHEVGQANVIFDPTQVDVQQLNTVVDEAGYEVVSCEVS